MPGVVKKSLVAAAMAASVTGGMVATAGSAGASSVTCYSEANPPQVHGPATVRAYGTTSCGDPGSFVLEYRPDVNSPWTNVTTSRSPGNGAYLYVYGSPVGTGYFRASIGHSTTSPLTTYSPDVYLVV